MEPFPWEQKDEPVDCPDGCQLPESPKAPVGWSGPFGTAQNLDGPWDCSNPASSPPASVQQNLGALDEAQPWRSVELEIVRAKAAVKVA